MMNPSPKIDRQPPLTSHPLAQKSRFEWMPWAIVSLLLINSLLLWRLLGLNKAAVVSRPYIYLQKVDGTTERAEPVDELYRSNAVVKAFAEDWLKLAYTWRFPNQDSGVTERRVKYPRPLHTASMALAPGYREIYLTSLEQKYSQQFSFEQYLSGKNQSYVRVFEQPIVEQVEPGVWDVTVIATRTHARGNAIMAQENFNHVLRLKAIDPGNQRLGHSEHTTLEKLFNQMQNLGLQIIKINQY